MCPKRIATLVLSLALLGCPSEISAPDAAPPVVDAGPPPPPPQMPLELEIRGTGIDGGPTALTPSDGGLPLLESLVALELMANQPLLNYRIRVFDDADRAMVSDDETADAPGPLRYRIQFPEPLRSGHRYAVVVDAQTGAALTDAQGRPIPDHRLELRIAGERAKTPPPPAKKKRRRR